MRRGTVCGGRRWSAVVRCKSPSTAFNYDVIANTDDGYFLRYTLYITRPYGVDYSRARTKGRGSVCVRPYVLTTKPCDCFRMFQNTAPETRFSPTILSDSLTPCLDPFLNRSSRMKLLISYWENIMATISSRIGTNRYFIKIPLMKNKFLILIKKKIYLLCQVLTWSPKDRWLQLKLH